MRNNKNNINLNVGNITLNLENIISFYRNITSHLTDKEKILTLRFRNIILTSIIIMLSFANMTLCSSNIFNNSNVSALDYSSNVGVGFTFNPTLSISLSSSDLVISNLVPGSTLDSNSINVSVATNASYGYTLSATAGDSNHDNSNLTHTNNTDVFSSIAIDANLASLDTDNTWGYTSKLSNETAWSNYNGLSSSSNTILLDNSNAADSTGSVDFKISAKAGNTQPSGEYTGTINFIAVSKVAPMSLLDSFIASGAEQLNGYYKMQDMTHDICEAVDIEESELQLIDIRDNKIYWVAKLKDGNCWMTQNLDLDLSPERPLTSEDTDISVDSYDTTIYAASSGYTMENNVVKWTPKRSTIAYNDLRWAEGSWQNDYNSPYSYDYLDKTAGALVYPDGKVPQSTAGYHGLSGNYYNWPAVVASNNGNNAESVSIMANSICSKNWRLPITNEFYIINDKYNGGSRTEYDNLTKDPLFFVRSGRVDDAFLKGVGSNGIYWGSKVSSGAMAPAFYFDDSEVSFNFGFHRNNGLSVRCLAR